MGECNALCEGRAGVHMGLYRHTGRAPAPGEGQEGPYRGTHEALQVHREGTCSRGGARRPHEDTGQLSLQAAGAEDLYGARGGGGGNTWGRDGEKGVPRHTSGAVCGLSPTDQRLLCQGVMRSHL